MSIKGYTTDEAFALVLSEDELWLKTGRQQRQRSSFLDRIRHKIHVATKTKEKILREAGLQVVQEAEWKAPEKTPLLK